MMKKRFLAVVTALLMTIAIFPAMVYASEAVNPLPLTRVPPPVPGRPVVVEWVDVADVPGVRPSSDAVILFTPPRHTYSLRGEIIPIIQTGGPPRNIRNRILSCL